MRFAIRMLELIGIALAIMLGWGIGDFYISIASKKIGPYALNLWNNLLGLAATSVIYLIFFYPKTVPMSDWWIIAILPFISVAAALSFFRALQVGNVSLITPISSSYGVW